MAGASEYTQTSRVIFTGPCVVQNVHMAAHGAAAECIVYDGVNTGGTLKAHLDALSGTSFHWHTVDGTDFVHGIYIAVGGSSARVTVTFKPKGRKPTA